METKGKVDVLLGLQWGDEGKGKVVDVLTPDYDVVALMRGIRLNLRVRSMFYAQFPLAFSKVGR